MIGLLNEMVEARFWDTWDSKFSLNKRDYIKPDHPEVVALAEELDINVSRPDSQIAKRVSNWIRQNYEYGLEKRWREPQVTIQDQKGDCEDYVFLLASILPNHGVNEYTIVAGDARAGKRSELHVWMEVGGKVVDPTATKDQTEYLTYVPELRYKVNARDY